VANNPLQKLQDAVVGTVKDAVRHPVGTAGKAVSQAKETVAVGRTVAEQVVGGVVGGVASGVAARVGRVARGAAGTPAESAAETAADTAANIVGDVVDKATGGAGSDAEAPAAPTPIDEAPTKKAAAEKAAAKKAAAKKAATKAAAKRAGTRPRVTKPPVTDLASKVVAEQAKHQPVPEAPTGPENPIDAAADPRLVDATPADVAKATAASPGKKAAANRSPAKKAATPAKTAGAKKAATKKATGTAAARKASPRKSATPSGNLPVPGSAAGKEPLSAEELAAGAGPETITPVGTRGADVAHNPDTTSEDLQQPGTPPLMDPGTVHAIEAEAETLSRAADPDKG
jgi:hypothetical protein